MSHYPTSAELQDFRRAIRPAWYAQDFTGHDLTGKEWPMAPLDHTPNRTTRAWGIPVRNGRLHVPGIARREAAAMRSRAYSALDPQNYWLPRATMRTAAWDERRYGVPTLYRDCECCGNPAGKCDCYGIGC